MKGTGLKKETAAALSVLFGPIVVVPILFLILEKDVYIRFYAMQAILSAVSFYVAMWIMGALALTIVLAPITLFINSLLMIGGIILWLVMVYRAWMGTKWELPLLGKLTGQLLAKIK